MSAAARRFFPLLDRVLVQKAKASATNMTKSGIYLPETSKSAANEAVVIAVGPGKVLNTGEVLQPSVKEGDTVIVPEYGGMSLKFDEEEFHVFRNEDLIGIMKK